jgi:hypothetical protein
MDSAVFDQLQQSLTKEGPETAIDRLCTLLRGRNDYPNLFYALLLKKRHELGVSPIPTGPSSDLPPETHQPYEDGIREAAREVGRLLLADGNIPHAWAYFRMIGEPEPVKAALEQATPGPDDDIQPLVDIAYYQGVHARKGFDWILDRYGICNAITTVSSQEVGLPTEVREHCLRRLVRALYEELLNRIRAAVTNREGRPPAEPTVRALLAAHPWLCDSEFPHIDTSHLSAVVQMSLHLPAGPELSLARELCAYGQRLPEPFRHKGDPPFDDFYNDHAAYLAALAGDEPDTRVARFREKVANANPETDGTRPAEVLVNLLLRLDRAPEALSVARQHLTRADPAALVCPGIAELCQRAGDYRTLSEVAREQEDPVQYLAGLLAERGSGSGAD